MKTLTLLLTVACTIPALAQDSWTQRSNGIHQTDHAVATLGADVYAVSGWFGTTYAARFARYTPASDSWTELASIPIPENSGFTTHGWYRSAAAAVNGAFYQIGGMYTANRSTRGPSREVWKYTIADATWSRVADLPAGIVYSRAAVSGDKIYVVGNQPAGSQPFWMYETAADRWTQLADLPFFRFGHALGIIDERIYLAGGSDGTLVRPTASWTFDLRNPSAGWRSIAAHPDPRIGSAFAISGNRFFVMGGAVSQNMPICPTYEYDPSRDAWTQRAHIFPDEDMPVVLSAAATVPSTGQVVLVGGGNGARMTREYTPPTYGGAGPADPNGLRQRWAGGSDLPEGARVASSSFEIVADCSHPDSEWVRLDVEVGSAADPFVAAFYAPGRFGPAASGMTTIVSGLAQGSYRFRCRVVDWNGRTNPGGWIYFGVPSAADFTVDLTAPPTSTPLSPGGNDVEVRNRAGSPIAFGWTASSDGTPVTYDVQVAGDVSFLVPLANLGGIGATSTALPLAPTKTGETRVWRVRAVDLAGNASAWTLSAPFTVTYVERADDSNEAVKACGMSEPGAGPAGHGSLIASILALACVFRGSRSRAAR